MVAAAIPQDGVIVFDGPARIRPIANAEGLSRYMDVLRPC